MIGIWCNEKLNKFIIRTMRLVTKRIELTRHWNYNYIVLFWEMVLGKWQVS